MKKQAKASAGKKSSSSKSKSSSSSKAKTKSTGKTKKASGGRAVAARSGLHFQSESKSQTAQGPKKLLMKLAEDPQIKLAMDTIDHGANAAKIETFRDTVQTFMSMSRSFIGSKRALKLAAYAEVMILAYRLGLLLKTNILDRPEVKSYLEENFQGLKSNPAFKAVRSLISNAIGKEETEDAGQETKSSARSAKSKWNESNKSMKADSSEESDEASDSEEGEHLTRQQRRHQAEREANLAAMKNQGNSGPNRAEKRHAKGQAGVEDQSEAHSEFIPSHKANQGKSSSKNASKH